ncbi:MAG: TonB-dependent receptor [Opitutaceae bacterium]|nr:TonB-dependent receptor [Opitutaceae bacterium]
MLCPVFATNAFAAETDPELHTLPPWTIAESLNRHLQTARGDYFASTLGPSSVVAAADWSGRGITTLAEALRHTPGVMLQESFGGFEPPRLSIRGSGLDSAPTSRGVALLLDGLPLARADGSFHSGLFDPQLFPRVEIYRGTLHMALTPAVLGGVINAATLAPDVAPAVTIRAEGGDFGAFRGQITGTTSGPASTHAAASYQSAEGWREHSQQDRAAIQLAAHRALNAATQLEVSAYAATLDYDVPGPLTLAEAQARPRSVSAAVLRDLPRRTSTVIRAAAQLKSATAAGDAAVGLAWQQLRDDFYQLQANGESALDARALTGHATLARRMSFGGTEHQFLARAIFTTGSDSVDRYRNVLSQRGAAFGAYTARADTFALNAEDVVWLRPTLAVGAGFTALHGKRQLTGRVPSSDLRSSFDFDDFSPRGALLWSPDGHVSLHAAISRGVEPPVFDDLVAVQGTYPNLSLGTRTLTPQSAVTAELGGRGSLGPFDWNLTAYHAAWRNEILRLADAAGLPRGAVNAGRTIHTGLESSLRWRLLEGDRKLSFTVTSTLGRFHFDDDPVYGRNRLAGAPPHTGAAELLYENSRGWFAALETTWVAGRIPVDHANRMSYDGHALGHVRLGWRPRADFLIFATVRNVFDHRYIASTAGVLDLARNPATTSLFLPGPGRAFTLGLEWKP